MGNGKEIVGFGYQMQNAGVETIIASLWRVNDDSDKLMNTFYTVLQEGKSKAQQHENPDGNTTTSKSQKLCPARQPVRCAPSLEIQTF